MSMRDHLGGGRASRVGSSSPPSTKIFALGALLVGLIITGVALYVTGQAQLVLTDPTTLCPSDRPPSEVLVILLDMSDQFSEPQRLKIRNELDRIKATIGRFGLIEVYAVDRLDQRVTRPVVHLCNPGTGADMNVVYQNPDLARRKWAGFMQQLDAELDRLMAAPDSSTSAIFEAVQSIALRTFNRPDFGGLPKHLVIVSDLLQNVPGKLSHYQGVPSFEEFQGSDYFSEVRADLGGVGVTLLYLVRPRTPQKWPDHYRFWEQYFLVQGATVKRLEPVYGAP